MRIYENENSHYNKKDQIFSKYKFSHKDVDCRTRGRGQSLRRDTNTSNEKLVSILSHGNMWRRNSNYKDSEETQISKIIEVSKYDDEKNSDIDKNEIHYKGK